MMKPVAGNDHGMETLPDPSSLRDRSDVGFRAGRTVDEQDEFDYFSAIDGMVAVGLANEAGAVLLMNSPHGWRLPYGPVDPDEDWVAAGRHLGTELTGVDVAIDRAKRVNEVTHCLEEDDERTTSYDVVLGAESVAGEPIADDPSFGPWDELELGWVESVPDDAYWDHGDAVDDIRLFLD